MINKSVFIFFKFLALALALFFIVLALVTVFFDASYANVLFCYMMPKWLFSAWVDFIDLTPRLFFPSSPVNEFYDMSERIVGAVFFIAIANMLLVAAIWLEDCIFKIKRAD